VKVRTRGARGAAAERQVVRPDERHWMWSRLAFLSGLAAVILWSGCGDSTAPGPCTLPIVWPSEVDSTFELISIQAPIYPDTAKEQGHQGTVLVRTIVDHDGSVCECTVGTSSGWAELDSAAVAAATTARFTLAYSHGRAVRVLVIIPVEFWLHPLDGPAGLTGRCSRRRPRLRARQ
jgi:TonB family protein